MECGPIYWASHGTLTIKDGIFQDIVSNNSAAAIYQKNGIINIDGGTFIAKDGIKIGVEASNTTEVETNINAGTFQGTRSGIYFKTTNGGGNCTQFNINISGGTFLGNQKAIYRSLVGSTTIIQPTVAIKGGQFSKDNYFTPEYIPSTHKKVEKDNQYIVVPKVTGVSMKTSTKLAIGKEETLIPKVEPDGTIDEQIWTSSNEDIATVNQTGKVTALKEGTAEIKVNC